MKVYNTDSFMSLLDVVKETAPDEKAYYKMYVMCSENCMWETDYTYRPINVVYWERDLYTIDEDLEGEYDVMEVVDLYDLVTAKFEPVNKEELK